MHHVSAKRVIAQDQHEVAVTLRRKRLNRVRSSRPVSSYTGAGSVIGEGPARPKLFSAGLAAAELVLLVGAEALIEKHKAGVAITAHSTSMRTTLQVIANKRCNLQR
jgi:hypothetical protein